jgi:hypothetical protein
MNEPTSFTDQANAEGLQSLVTGKKRTRKPPVGVAPEPKPRREKTDEFVYDAAADQRAWVPQRQWYCLNRTNCKGRAKYTGVEQLLEHPVCPLCGHEMRWNQWLVRFK